MHIKNFGRNVSYEPAHHYEPETEAEVLDILNRHAGGTIRVAASGHAWSPAIETTDTAIRVGRLNHIDIRRGENGSVIVQAGGGAVLSDLVRTVEAQTDYTLPTMGGILKQTISGAISTGTHGSGRPSLSHYMEELRIAAYDPDSGKPQIYTYTEGEALRAARCAVGRMGVIVSVTFHCVPKYLVAETISEVISVAELLERDRSDSLEQAILLPHSWRLLVYDRVIKYGPLSRLNRVRAAIRSAVSVLYIDIGLHVIVAAIAFAVRRNLGGLKVATTLYRSVIPASIRKNVTHTGNSTNMLTLKHDLFRHVEMELFIPKHNISQATDTVQYILSVAADGNPPTPKDHVLTALKEAGTEQAIEDIRGTYIHHYPLYFRRILPDDTLISMASSTDGPYYSLSFFTYYPPNTREPFYNLCWVIAKTLESALDVRPHWGKYNPLIYGDIKHLYPHMPEFHRQCRAVDPYDTFSNEYTRRALGV